MFSSSSYFYIVLCLNCVTLAKCFLSINQANIVHRDVTSVSIQEIKFPSGSPRNALPSSMSVTLNVRGQEVTLNLLRNTDLQYIPTPILASREKVYRERENSKYAHYQDRTTLAAVEIECRDERCKGINLFGTLFVNGELILFQKQPAKDVSSSEVYDVIHSSTNHISHGMDYAISNQKKVQSTSRKNKLYYLDRRKRATGTYTLELLLVIDYSFYKYWYDKQSTSVTEASRRAAAIDDVKRYCAFFINGIDLRFDDLTGGSYTINVVFAGIFIMETLQSSPFTSAEGLIDAETALNTFSQWINRNSATLPGHDHAMIITRLDLMRDGSTATRGYAFLGTMCSFSSQSVVEDNFDFMTQTVAAHEIGHGLNAVHDGDSNSCLASAGYIMVATSQVFPPSDSRRQNPWKFSSCSVNEMSAFIDTLSSNCLRTTEATDTSGLDAYTATPIGQILSPDTQCLYKYGTGSYFGRSFYNESTLSTLCTSMYCRDPTTSNFYKLMVPGHGTSCGNNKWCSGGQCIASSQAPALSGTCPFGDSPGIAYDGKNCSEYIKSSPWSCYTDSVYRTCCTSCEAIRTSISGCEFGDRTNCASITSGSGCYAGTNADVCCGTCQQYKTGITDCMYGDRTDCSGVSSQGCYQNEALCCLHCFQYQTGIPDCKFGDRFQQCSSGLCNLYPTECCGTCYTGTTVLPTLPTTTVPTTTLPTTRPTTRLTTTTVRSSTGGATAASTKVLVQSTTSSTTAAQSTSSISTVIQSTVLPTTRAQPTVLPTTKAQSTVVHSSNVPTTEAQSSFFQSKDYPSTQAQSTTSFRSTVVSTTIDLSTLSSTTQSVTSSLEDWIVPVASIIGGVILLIIAISLFVCFMKRRKSVQRRRSSRRSRAGIDGPFVVEERSTNLVHTPYKIQNGAQAHAPYLVQNGVRYKEPEVILPKVPKPTRPPPPRPIRSPSQKGYVNSTFQPAL